MLYCYIANGRICHLDANHRIRHIQLVNADDPISNAGASVYIANAQSSNADARVLNNGAQVSNDDVQVF
jgi:hypothetical protein